VGFPLRSNKALKGEVIVNLLRALNNAAQTLCLSGIEFGRFLLGNGQKNLNNLVNPVRKDFSFLSKKL
jgi:hypothetical protein